MRSLLNTAHQSGAFGTFIAALEVVGLDRTLFGLGPFTLFAPTDAAFRKLSPDEVDALLTDLATFTEMLTNHIVKDEVWLSDLSVQSVIQAYSGNHLRVDAEAEKPIINGADIIEADIQCTNGILHVIDTVLVAELMLPTYPLA